MHISYMIVTKIIGFYTIIDDDYMLVLFDFFFFLKIMLSTVCVICRAMNPSSLDAQKIRKRTLVLFKLVCCCKEPILTNFLLLSLSLDLWLC